jgi:hypothetical protein
MPFLISANRVYPGIDTMNRFKKKSVIVLSTLVVFCVFGVCPSPSEASEHKPAGKISSTQKKFVNALGYPDQFVILFVYDQLDEKKRVLKQLSRPRTLEAWLYARGQRTYAIFDNGYFTEEARIEPDIAGDPPPLAKVRPQQFAPGMTKARAARLFGEPEHVEAVDLGKHRYEVLRYVSPERGAGVFSLTFLDGKLVCVMAGLALQVPDVQALVVPAPVESR